jgi:hypothetical protein
VRDGHALFVNAEDQTCHPRDHPGCSKASSTKQRDDQADSAAARTGFLAESVLKVPLPLRAKGRSGPFSRSPTGLSIAHRAIESPDA